MHLFGKIVFMENELRTAMAAAVAAGLEIMDIYNRPETEWEVAFKADHSPLTLADRKAHAVIREKLQSMAYPLLSEEGDDVDYAVRSQWDRFWIVDPLDGTKEFVKRNGEFTVNIALVDHGQPILGVVYVPVSRVLYFGSVATGAFKAVVTDPENLDILEPQRLPMEPPQIFTIVASRSHLSPETVDYIEAIRQQKGEVRTVQGGSSLKICYVAEGVAHLYPRLGPTMEWDTAAGHALVKAAGGEMYDAHTGKPVHYNKEDLHSPWFIVKGAGVVVE